MHNQFYFDEDPADNKKIKPEELEKAKQGYVRARALFARAFVFVGSGLFDLCPRT